jgi:hypothetical protein
MPIDDMRDGSTASSIAIARVASPSCSSTWARAIHRATFTGALAARAESADGKDVARVRARAVSPEASAASASSSANAGCPTRHRWSAAR